MKYIFGADIGGTTVKLGLFEEGGSLAHKWEITTNKADGGKNILTDIAKSIYEKMAEKGISKSDVKGIGVGVPGPVTAGGVVNGCVNLGWGVINIEEKLSELTGLEVKAGNDANVAALGEMLCGGGKGFNSIIMITLGTGVGGGVIIDGKMVYGTNGAGGEIGHFPINTDETEKCGCGNKGCLEQYCSATGIVRTANKILSKGNIKSYLKSGEITAKDVLDAAKAGDEAGLKALEDFGEKMGRFLAAAAVFFDPQAFLFGGGVSKAGGIIIDAAKKYYDKYAFHATKNTEFRLASLGNDAGIYGCAGMFLS